jgi:hypothetical protein
VNDEFGRIRNENIVTYFNLFPSFRRAGRGMNLSRNRQTTKKEQTKKHTCKETTKLTKENRGKTQMKSMQTNTHARKQEN